MKSIHVTAHLATSIFSSRWLSVSGRFAALGGITPTYQTKSATILSESMSASAEIPGQQSDFHAGLYWWKERIFLYRKFFIDCMVHFFFLFSQPFCSSRAQLPLIGVQKSTISTRIGISKMYLFLKLFPEIW